MLAQAHTSDSENGWSNIRLVEADAADFDFPTEVDGILSTYALTQVPECAEVIAHGAAALSGGGRWVVLDLKVPDNAPDWLAQLGTAIVRPFASIDEWIMRRPGEAIRVAMQKNWPISPGPSCRSEPRSSLSGPAAALEPPGNNRCGAGDRESRCSMARPLPQIPRTDVMPYTTFRAISATILALVLSACGGSSRSSTSSTMPATSTTAANPVQRENSRPGTPGWEIPAGAGTVITGYASETSVAPGQSVHLHVAAPPVSRYRVLVYRLGWYRDRGTPDHVRAWLPLEPRGDCTAPANHDPAPSPGCSGPPGE